MPRQYILFETINLTRGKLNFMWPDEPSYENPIVGFKYLSYRDCCLKLKSGEKSHKTISDDGFENINWSNINSIKINCRYDGKVFGICGLNSQGQCIQKITYISNGCCFGKKFNLRKGDRVVGFICNVFPSETDSVYHNLMLIIMGPE